MQLATQITCTALAQTQTAPAASSCSPLWLNRMEDHQGECIYLFLYMYRCIYTERERYTHVKCGPLPKGGLRHPFWPITGSPSLPSCWHNWVQMSPWGHSPTPSAGTHSPHTDTHTQYDQVSHGPQQPTLLWSHLLCSYLGVQTSFYHKRRRQSVTGNHVQKWEGGSKLGRREACSEL